MLFYILQKLPQKPHISRKSITTEKSFRDPKLRHASATSTSQDHPPSCSHSYCCSGNLRCKKLRWHERSSQVSWRSDNWFKIWKRSRTYNFDLISIFAYFLCWRKESEAENRMNDPMRPQKNFLRETGVKYSFIKVNDRCKISRMSLASNNSFSIQQKYKDMWISLSIWRCHGSRGGCEQHCSCSSDRSQSPPVRYVGSSVNDERYCPSNCRP
jgi:hypothetical protein